MIIKIHDKGLKPLARHCWCNCWKPKLCYCWWSSVGTVCQQTLSHVIHCHRFQTAIH